MASPFLAFPSTVFLFPFPFFLTLFIFLYHDRRPFLTPLISLNSILHQLAFSISISLMFILYFIFLLYIPQLFSESVVSNMYLNNISWMDHDLYTFILLCIPVQTLNIAQAMYFVYHKLCVTLVHHCGQLIVHPAIN